MEAEAGQAEPVFAVTVRARAYHADLLDAARRHGGTAAFAAHLGVCEATLGNWIGLRTMPDLAAYRKRGRMLRRWPEIERKLVEATGKRAEELFPGFVRLSGFLDAPKVAEQRVEMPAGTMLAFRNRPALLPPPERAAEMGELREEVNTVLRTLTYRQREVLKMRYGLDGGQPLTLEECARVFKVTRERVRSIEAQAIWRIKETERAGRLAGFLHLLGGGS